MKSIGFKNFRRFADFPSTDLGEITILVGANNSGKSTIVKAILLCIDNLRLMRMSDRRASEGSSVFFRKPLFRFDANEYHDPKVKTFARAIHNKPVEEEDLTYGKVMDLPSSISFIFTIDQFIFTFVVSGDRDENLTTGDVIAIVVEDTKARVRYVANYESHVMSYDLLNREWDRQYTLLINLIKSFRSTENSLKKAQSEGDLSAITELSSRLDKIVNQAISLLGKENTDLVASTDDFLKIIRKAIKKFQDLDMLEASYEVPMSTFNVYSSEPVVLNIISNFINLADTSSVEPILRDGEDPEEYEIRLQQFQDYEDTRSFIKSEKDSIAKSRQALSDLLYSIDVQFIPAHSVHQNSLYTDTEKDYLAKVVHEFCRERIIKGEKEYEFVKTWMGKERFNIGENFTIESLSGEAYQVNISGEDGTSVPLGDKGMGSIQIMILLLRLATIIRRNKSALVNPIIIIEEPEQNLHPKMQSRLAELFNEMVRNYNCQFIIETHSEYIVRKAQVLVAEEKYIDEEDMEENNPFKIYYLPEDGSERYEMKFTTKGRFANKFGKGFFDTASELAFELF